MAMRDLVTGGAACAVPGTSSSNPIGALANVLIGSSSKTQERLKEIPNSIPTTSGSISESERQLSILPGSELDHESLPYVDRQTSEFLRGFHSADHGALADAWDDIHSSRDYNFHLRDQGVDNLLQPILEGPPQRILSSFLQSFISSSHRGIPFNPAPLPVLGLSDAEKLCIRDRSSIMARHLFADKSEDYINAQVNALLSSLDIDTGINSKHHIHSRFREMEEYWNESNPAMKGLTYLDSPWVTEFERHKLQYEDPDTWAHSFQQHHGANGWASEFEQMQSSMTSANQVNMSAQAAMEQTRMLAHTLAQNADPKFQKSKFLQFVSKMSRGELIIDDEQIKPGASTTSIDWASEYQKEHTRPVTWGDEFAHHELTHVPNRWANEFSNEQTLRSSTDEQWANEFSKLHINDWAEEFGHQVGEGALGDDSADKWAASYDEYLSEQIAAKQGSDSSKGVYAFSDMNPYVGHPAPLKEGQELFRKGLLSEAVLSLEAEVLKNRDNAEGWRLLGIAHAENDDDQQAIAAMMRAQEVEPKNLEVLLALGVSHTNELEQAAALKYLYGWLCNHPKYGALAPPELANSLYFADIAKAFSEAAQMSPDDADIHIVLGVLYNLSREYDKAMESFRTALKLKPHDYSLWNKLGATKANSVQSADAILAYQQALDLKPNYVRAWTNMGISYANQGMYQESIRYYVRALAMNPKAENAWQYLRISLSCALRSDMMSACDSRNLDILQKEFPL